MKFFKSHKKDTSSARENRHAPKKQKKSEFFEFNSLLTLLLFIIFSGCCILICFVGLSPAGPQIIEDQIARTHIVSEFKFSYTSEILTNLKIEKRRKRVPPIYRLDFEDYNKFNKYITRFIESLHELGIENDSLSTIAEPETIAKFISDFDPRSKYNINSDDVATLIEQVNADKRKKLFDEGLIILRKIFHEGIYGEEHAAIKSQTGNLSFFNIERESGHIVNVNVQSEEDALRSLRINLSALDISREISDTLFRILRNGLNPNLIYDQVKSEKKIQQLLTDIESVVVNVEVGQTIIDPGSRVNSIQIEQLNEYRRLLKTKESSRFTFDSLLWERSLLTFIITITLALYIKLGNSKLYGHNRNLTLCGLITLLNLGVIRLILETGDSALLIEKTPDFIGIMPFLAPIAFGPIIISILMGPLTGIVAATLISLFNTLMQGNSIPVLLVGFLSSLVGIYACRNIKVRTKLVRAGALSGSVMAISSFFLGLREALDFVLIVEQMAGALTVGLVTGIAVVGFLPILENLFKYTTDITLLELTDFNHPLLRRMQLTAPGSYHHSLMVANLAENAAAAIGANPLVCRVCSIFHDVGKIVKPEYFTENQNEGNNPHFMRNPSMSALVIKAHVKEGVALAKQHKLPKLIIDVIQQHHGTTLIQYFYYKALQSQKSTLPPLLTNAPSIDLGKVNESTYRYEGPKPKFKESAIIFFADSVEAASRSLKKVSPQSIDELIDNIIQDRIKDGQLSDCPLTFKEIDIIKKQFSFTILNMLHSRVEYPKSKKEQSSTNKTAHNDKTPKNIDTPDKKESADNNNPQSKSKIIAFEPEEKKAQHPGL